MREMGSEFWSIEAGNAAEHWWNKVGYDQRYYASGRTALDAIIQDIKIEKDCSSAYLPSYCCNSMIDPFLSNGVRVEFYSVSFNRSNLVVDFNNEHNCDIVYLMDYFGFHSVIVDEILEREAKKGNVIIQDATHSLLQEKPYSNKADYIFTSFRKWSAVPGAGIAIKMKSPFSVSSVQRVHSDYVEMRNQAMGLKAQFMCGEPIDKNKFLGFFNEAEELLNVDYSGYGIEHTSKDSVNRMNIEYIRKKRRENAGTMITKLEGLKQNTVISLVFFEMSDSDCPLFVPILVREDLRNSLYKFFIERQVYCPVHWPLTKIHTIDEKNKGIYNSELSLICDQRYTTMEVSYEVDLIKRFISERC